MMAPLRSGMEHVQSRREPVVVPNKQGQQRQLGAPTTAVAEAAAAVSQDTPAQQIIECRKKNANGESVVTHRFRKGRFLGKGGFAHCYKVTCLETSKLHAMKIVPKSTLVKSRARQKLQTEIKIHRTLQHPRIVRFEMFFEDRENVYILLELCTNHTLSELIRKTKRFTEDEARRYMLQILDATSYLHRHQIIHRDLKLGNVFLDKDWNIKMGDFGLATKLVQDSERKRTICGTPNYIAPEILEGTAGHSYQVDLWSAGVILYTMLVGRPPYESTDVKSTYRRILANVYAFPESVPVSDSAKNLVGRLLQIKPEQRPSLDEMLNHPFLRNGGPRQRFSTAHGLRGSSSSQASTSGGRACDPLSTAAAAVGGRCALKHPAERGSAARIPSRVPLKTRGVNAGALAEAEGKPDNSSRAVLKPRLVRSASAGPDRGGERDDSGNRNTGGGGASHVGPPGLKRPSVAAPSCLGGARTTRSAVPRAGKTKGFSVYCDVKEFTTGTGGSPSSNKPGSEASVGAHNNRRTSPVAGRRRREKGNSGSGGSEAEVSANNKENDPRSTFGAGGGARVAVNGPISRRPLLRSASMAAGGKTPAFAVRTGPGRGNSNNTGGGGTKGPTASHHKPVLRRSASSVGTQVDGGRLSTRLSLNPGATSETERRRGVAAGRLPGATVAASPRFRSSTKYSGSVATATPTPYRSPAVGSSSGGGARVASKGGGGTITPNTKGAGLTSQKRLDFGGTPRLTRQQQRAPLRSSSAVGGSSSEKATRKTAFGTSPPPPPTRGSLAGKKASAAVSAVAATALGVAALPKTIDPERDTLENMHDLLTSSFALEGVLDNKTRPATVIATASTRLPGAAARGTRATTAREAERAGVTPPRVWITKYIDYSCKYGLGFLLSDGSAGVYFNDATKIVLEPAGVSFDYVERARKSSPAAVEGRRIAGGARPGEEQPPRARHTLGEYPPELRKKVTLLNHFRGYLNDLVKKDGKGEASSASAAIGNGEGGGRVGEVTPTKGQTGKGSLTFLKKWLRTQNAILFRLSNRTVQVVFSDHTEILLTKDARAITFVGKHGKRETQPLARVMEEQRLDVIKRVRYSKELIAQLLRRA